MNNEIEDLRERFKNLIVNTCNKIGCKNCHLEWKGGCPATELQDKINDLEMEEFKNKNKN